MNTNEFYKELFEKYALDEEKIRRNAIKEAKTPAWKRTLGTHWKSAAGIAAAVAVTVGAVAYTAANPPENINVTPTESMLSASQRLHDAENDYYNMSADEFLRANIYVSFRNSLCFKEMTVAFSAVEDSEEIETEAIYLEDGTVIRGAAEISEFAESSGSVKNITGAKLSAPSKCFKDIMDLSAVRLAELGSDKLNDDTFTPIIIDDSDPLMDDLKFISTTALSPSATTTPFSFAEESSASSEASASDTSAASDSDADTTVSDDIGDSEDNTEVSDPDDIDDDTTVPVEIREDDGDTDNISEDNTGDYTTADDPDITETSSEVPELTVPVTEIPDAPDTGLMTQIYQLNVENSLETFLINEYAIVLTRDEAYIYKLAGSEECPAEIFKISNPKIGYSDRNNVLITGCGDDGLRNRLVVLDMNTGAVYSSDVSASIGDAEIATINHSSSDGKYFLKTISASSTYFYEVTLSSESGVQYRPLLAYEGAVTAAGYKNGMLRFTASLDGVNYDLYSFDCTRGVFYKEAEFGNVCKVRKSSTFESFVISATDRESGEAVTYVYDINSSLLIPIELDGEIRIALSGGINYVGSGDKNYSVLPDGTLTETTLMIHYGNRTEAAFAVVSVDPDKVVVSKKSDNTRR